MAISHDDLIQAVAYCRLGAARRVDGAAFEEAKRRGLLSQDPTWRATAQGEGALIAAHVLSRSKRSACACTAQPELFDTDEWGACDCTNPADDELRIAA